FKGGEINVLVCTSVGGEGLDIPATDLVVFYEPIPSEIRTIQRRGRTGRGRAGRVVMLVTRGTRDQAYFYSARRKEYQMHQELDRLRRDLRQTMLALGTPGAETKTDAGNRFQGIRDRRESRAPTPEQAPKKPGQAKLPDY
ncbi:MAG TPA: helicase-related protein, partial [Thermoplasmata archaeon]|nr:helicase-related protein [Thermoplasmata archaeon]